MRPLVFAGATLVAWLALSCGDNGPDATTIPTATDSPAPTSNSTNGEADFESFGNAIASALESEDTAFFLMNTRIEEVSCDSQGFPAPPAGCDDEAPGSSVRAISIGVWQSEGFFLAGDQYQEFMSEFLSNYEEEDDTFGPGRPTLVLYGTFRDGVEVVPGSGSDGVHVVMTWIPGPGGDLIPVQPGSRVTLVLGARLDGGSWSISHYHIGPKAFIAPDSSEAHTAGVTDAFEHWHLWEN